MCAGRLSRFGATSFGAGRKMSHDGDYLEVAMPTMKGRITIRREKGSTSPGDPLQPYRPRSRTIEPWILETAAGTTLAKLEQAYMDALAAVDAVYHGEIGREATVDAMSN